MSHIYKVFLPSRNITATSTGRNHVPAIIDSTLNACRLYNGANKPLLTESQAASKTEIES